MSRAAYLRELRAKAKAEGKCSICRAGPAREAMLTCVECSEKGSKDKRRRNAERLSEGVCTQCRGPMQPGRTWTCLTCKPLIQGSMRSLVIHQAAVRKQALGGIGKCERCKGKAVKGMLYCANHGRAYATQLRSGHGTAA